MEPLQTALSRLLAPNSAGSLWLSGYPTEATSSRGLCRMCLSLSAEALVSESGFRYYDSFGAFEKKAAGCRLCWIAWKAFLSQLEDLKKDGQVDLGGLRKLCLRCLEDGELAIVLEGDRRWKFRLSGLSVVVPDDDVAVGCGIPSTRRSLTNTRSPETLSFIKDCLQKCSDTHAWCRSDPGPSADIPASWRPTRLLDLRSLETSDPGTDAIKLTSIGDDDGDYDKCPQYMTLSYSWGGQLPATAMTTQTTLTSREDQILLADLPLTFQHAIEITRRLDTDYLWIDALCIIQDSRVDWTRESVKMGGIYRHSHLTISANIGPNTKSGCFSEQSVPMDKTASVSEYVFEIPNTGTSRSSTTKLCVVDTKGASNFDDHPSLLASPLRHRGWVYQERLLSSRSVFFTSDQVFWECKATSRQEDQLPCLPYPAPYRRLLSSIDRWSTAAKYDWYHAMIERDYSRRVFASWDDRLIAVAGVAERLEAGEGDEYLAGIWRRTEAYGLAWRSCGTHNKSGLTERKPTWTWASVDAPVRWTVTPDTFLPEPFRIISTSVDYVDKTSGRFGLVQGGFITVTARLVKIKATETSEKDGTAAFEILGQTGGTIFIDYPHFEDFAKAVPHELDALLLCRFKSSDNAWWSTYCLLVLAPRQGGEAESYWRIGYAEIRFTFGCNDAILWKRFPMRAVHLY